MTSATTAPPAAGPRYAAYPSLRGRVAFVSGGSTGLGAEFVAGMVFGGFGGPVPTDLFIGTSTEGPSAQELRNEPSAGAIFHAVPGHRGRSVTAFACAETTGP